MTIPASGSSRVLSSIRRLTACTSSSLDSPSMEAVRVPSVMPPVPGAQVAGDGERDLAPQSEGWSEELFEAGQELELRGVPHGRLVRVELEPWAQAHRPRRATELLERGVVEVASLQRPELPPGHAGSSSGGGQAHSPLAAGRSYLAPGRREEAACVLGAAVAGPFPCCHAPQCVDRHLADAYPGRLDAAPPPGPLGVRARGQVRTPPLRVPAPLGARRPNGRGMGIDLGARRGIRCGINARGGTPGAPGARASRRAPVGALGAPDAPSARPRRLAIGHRTDSTPTIVRLPTRVSSSIMRSRRPGGHQLIEQEGSSGPMPRPGSPAPNPLLTPRPPPRPRRSSRGLSAPVSRRRSSSAARSAFRRSSCSRRSRWWGGSSCPCSAVHPRSGQPS